MAREKAKTPYRPAVGDHVMWGSGNYNDGVVEQVIEVPGKRHAIALVRRYMSEYVPSADGESGKYRKRPSSGLTTISTGCLRPYKKRAY